MQPFERAWFDRASLPPIAVAFEVYVYAELVAVRLSRDPMFRCRITECVAPEAVDEVMRGLIGHGFCTTDDGFSRCAPVPIMVRLSYCPLAALRRKTTRLLVRDMLRAAIDEWSNQFGKHGGEIVVAP